MADSGWQRHAALGATIALAHGLALWALLSGLNTRAPEVLVPVVAMADIITPHHEAAPAQAPRPAPAKPAPSPMPPAPRQAIPVPTQPVPPSRQVAPEAPSPVPAATPSPGTAASPSRLAAPGTPAATAAPPVRIEPPSSTADYLNNPKPVYPPLSKRLGEQGLVVVRVLIGADGLPVKSEVRQSSGFERLDLAALATTLKWRYVPGTRAGRPEAMWFNVPINFVLE